MATKTHRLTDPVPSRLVHGSDRGAAIDVSRDEFTKVRTALKNVNNVTRDEFVQATTELRDAVRQLEIQFQRIAQIQADIDVMKPMLAKLSQ